MNGEYFKRLLQELIDENPFAIRAVLRILGVTFTQRVPTLAVTREARPRLLVNLDFIGQHCHTDAQVKAVILHEFLHVLLRHTGDGRPLTPARHLALDAVINAIIHRQQGSDYSAMMARYYAGAAGLQRLLRPMNPKEREAFREGSRRGRVPSWAMAWDALYRGRLIADDIEALAQEIEATGSSSRSTGGQLDLAGSALPAKDDLLGNHDDLGQASPEALEAALTACLAQMNGAGIWREQKARGLGGNPYEALVSAADAPVRKWERRTLAILRSHLAPDRRSRAREPRDLDYRIPVLSPGDRRAFIRSLWSPYIPEAAWHTTVERPIGSAQVYFDVSGSMEAEMPLLITLLGRLSRYIRRPFWAFSDQVVPALIEKGRLKTITSGGASMACVLEHLAKTRPSAAVVITDGYIEPVDPVLLQQTAATRLHAIVTRDGSPRELRRAGIPCTQLEGVPA